MTWIKLTRSEVRQIREMALSGRYTLREIAEKFNITHTNVRFIRQGITWKNLWDDAPTDNAAIAGASLQNEE